MTSYLGLILSFLLIYAVNSLKAALNIEGSIVQSVAKFSAHYDIILLSDSDFEYRHKREPVQTCKLLASEHPKSAFANLVWPFNATLLSTIFREEAIGVGRRKLIILSFADVDNLEMILNLMWNVYTESNNRLVPIYLIMMGDGSETADLVADLVPSTMVDVNSDIYLININSSIDEISRIYELYSIKTIRRLQPFLANKADLMDSILIKATRRRNFFQVPFVGVVEKVDTTVNNGGVTVSVINGQLQFTGGFRPVEYQYMRDALNFTEGGLIQGTGFPFEEFTENGTVLAGMAEQMNNGKADIAVQSIEFHAFRVMGITYLHSTAEENLCAYFEQLPVNTMRSIYIHTFTMDLWIAYLGLWIALTLAGIWMEKVLAFDAELEPRENSEHFLQAVGTVCQQGWYEEPNRSSCIGILSLTRLLAAVILYAAYCGSLVSQFSVPDVPIQGFQDLLKHSFTLYTDTYSVAARELIQEMHSNREYMIGPTAKTRLRDPEDSLGKVLNSRAAFIAPQFMFYPNLIQLNYSEQFLCRKVSMVTNFMKSTKTAMILKKDSPFKESFNLKIVQMFERGIRSRLRRIQKLRADLNCLRDKELSGEKEAMRINDVFMAFVFLMLGFGFSMLILVVERILICRRH